MARESEAHQRYDPEAAPHYLFQHGFYFGLIFIFSLFLLLIEIQFNWDAQYSYRPHVFQAIAIFIWLLHYVAMRSMVPVNAPLWNASTSFGFRKTLETTLAPVLSWGVAWGTVWLTNFFSASAGLEVFQEFIMLLGGAILPIIILLKFGWVGYAIEQGSHRGGFIGKVCEASWILLIIVPLFFFLLGLSAVMADQGPNLLSDSTTGYREMWLTLRTSVVDQATETWTRVTGSIEVGGKTIVGIKNQTVAPYTGEVERQQGARLGVFVREQQAIRPVYELLMVDQELRERGPMEERVQWYGTIEARTFAEDLEVGLTCVYDPQHFSIRDDDDAPDPFRTPARPQRLSVFYTGEFVDEYSFDCSIPLAAVADTNEPSGRFLLEADFDFQTWGYATLAFMERDILTEYRRSKKDPAREIGVEPRVRAIYTPGPLTLGMFDKVPQPIGIDVSNPDANFLPAFGVTLQNAWVTQGEVTRIDSLILQVPEPFELVTDDSACIGGDGRPPVITTQGYNDRSVPEGYTWYRFDDLTFPDERQLRTIRCPLTVPDRRWTEVLGSDFSPRAYTFVALAEYHYITQSPVNSVRIQVVQS